MQIAKITPVASFLCRNQLLVSNLSLIVFGNQPYSLGWGKRIVLLSLGYCRFSTRSTYEHTHTHTHTQNAKFLNFDVQTACSLVANLYIAWLSLLPSRSSFLRATEVVSPGTQSPKQSHQIKYRSTFRLWLYVLVDASSGGFPWPTDWTQISCIYYMGGGFLTAEPPWGAQSHSNWQAITY